MLFPYKLRCLLIILIDYIILISDINFLYNCLLSLFIVSNHYIHNHILKYKKNVPFILYKKIRVQKIHMI